MEEGEEVGNQDPAQKILKHFQTRQVENIKPWYASCGKCEQRYNEEEEEEEEEKREEEEEKKNGEC